jgi:uncharacterized membrane protein YfcA
LKIWCPEVARHVIVLSGASLLAGRVVASAPLGFVIGISLGALGGGGSILAVPALVYGAGESAKAATTTSLVVVGMTALVGMVGHLRAGRVKVLSGLGFGLVGIGGSFVGSFLNRAIPGNVLLLAFSGLILFVAWRMRAKQSSSNRSNDVVKLASESVAPATHSALPLNDNIPVAGKDPAPSDEHSGRSSAGQSKARMAVRVLTAGTFVGLLTGFFGVGGGFVIVPALVLALGYAMPVAVGTSLLVIAVSSVEGLVFRLSSGIDWRIAIPFTLSGVLGVLIGARLAGRVPANRLIQWFIWLLVAVALYTALRSALAI